MNQGGKEGCKKEEGDAAVGHHRYKTLEGGTES